MADQLQETAHLLHATKAHLLLLGVQITSSRRRNGNTVTRLDTTTTQLRNWASLVILELGIRLSLASSLLLLLHRSNLATTIALASDILHHTGIS